MTLFKKLVFGVLDAIQIPQLFLALQKKRARIVLYHGVSPKIANYGIFNYRKKFITPEAFRRQLVWLKKHFTILPLSHLIELAKSPKSFPAGACALTFDDGYENIFKYAFPILRELKIPATIFLTTDFIDQKGPLWVDILEYAIGQTANSSLTITVSGKNHKFPTSSYEERITTDAYLRDYLKKIPSEEAKKLLEEIVAKNGKDLRKNFVNSPYQGLTWEEVKIMSREGIEFAPHTLTHPILSRLPAPEAKKEILGSLLRLKEVLGEKALPLFAYPNGQPGDFTEETIALTKESGFKAALTTIPGTLTRTSNLFSLPRFTLDGTDNLYLFRATVSGVRKAIKSWMP